jgi:uncharacterized protein YndB with AHSA1/START domain
MPEQEGPMDATKRTSGVETPPEWEFSLVRFFDGHRETLFRLMIDPLLIPRWWGPRRPRMVVDYMDVRPGGGWRFVQFDDEGHEYGFHGAYEEVDFPSRLTYSSEHEGMESENRVEAVKLEEANGGTQLTLTYVFGAQRARDAALDAGLLEDFAHSMDRLTGLLGERPEKVEAEAAKVESTSRR